MADQKFKVGEVVRRKSGGPAMTVMGYVIYGTGMGETKTYKCRWFANNKQPPCEGYFVEGALEAADAVQPDSYQPARRAIVDLPDE